MMLENRSQAPLNLAELQLIQCKKMSRLGQAGPQRPYEQGESTDPAWPMSAVPMDLDALLPALQP